MKIAMSGLTLTCLFSSSQVMGVAAEKRVHLIIPQVDPPLRELKSYIISF